MDISDVHAVQAGTFGRLFAAHGMRARRGRKVLEVEMGIEGEQAVGNFRIQPGNIAGYGADLLLVYLSGNQQGTGDEKRWLWPFGYPCAQCLEIIQGFSVCDATQSMMNTVIPCL